MAQVGRPDRKAELQEVARRADASVESVRAFFFRPGRLSAALRQRIADAVAETGYRPGKSTKPLLDGARVGYQLPRVLPGSSVNLVMAEQFQRLVLAVQRTGGVVVPFVVDPPVSGDLDVRGGTAEERASATLGPAAWLRSYAHALAPETYREVLRRHNLTAFVLNDPQVGDPRIAAMAADGVPLVALARVFDRRPDGALALDEGATFVANDYAAGFSALADSLRAAGCTRFAHVGFADDGSLIPPVRRAAVSAAIGGGSPHHAVHYDESTVDDAGLDDFLRTSSPDAVICDSDDLANLVQRSAGRVGLEPGRQPGPGRLVVTGVDDAPVRREAPPERRWPSLVLDHEAFVGTAVELLVDQRQGHREPAQRYVRPVIVGPLGAQPDDRVRVPAPEEPLDPPG